MQLTFWILLFRKLDIIAIMTEISRKEIEKFLMHGTFTAKLATVRRDGSPHVVPIWFILDNQKDRTRKRIGDIVFTTYEESQSIKHST
jgi:hypothetical protein